MRGLKFVAAFFICFASMDIHADRSLEIFGGSGLFWSGWTNSTTFLSDTRKSSTTDSAFMRESYFAGLRLNIFEPKPDSFMVTGLEFSGSQTTPLIEGKWNYRRENSNGKVIAESVQAADAASSPTVSALRGSLAFGLRLPLNDAFAYEFGVLFGLGLAKAPYAITYPDGSGKQTSGGGGIGFHGALRLALKFNLAASAVLGLEYRLFGEVFGLGSIIPGISSSSNSLSTSAHIFLMSVGYRYGQTEASPAAIP